MIFFFFFCVSFQIGIGCSSRIVIFVFFFFCFDILSFQICKFWNSSNIHLLSLSIPPLTIHLFNIFALSPPCLSQSLSLSLSFSLSFSLSLPLTTSPPKNITFLRKYLFIRLQFYISQPAAHKHINVVEYYPYLFTIYFSFLHTSLNFVLTSKLYIYLCVVRQPKQIRMVGESIGNQ